MRFEDRLRQTVGSVMGLGLMGGLAAGCDGGDGGGGGGGDTDGATPPDLQAVCEGEPPPADHQLALGYVTVEPGTPCPDAAEAQLQVNSCTFLEWQNVTCGLEFVESNQVFVNDGYGGYFASTTTAPTGTYVSPEVVDVCYYEAVFYLDPEHPTCGRPLLNAGRMVVAEVVPIGGGWNPAAHPVRAGLTPREREALGDYWLQSAVLEHASVASFSHFALDLMRFGAPPALLRDAHQAALDEIEHAKLCFSLASGYRGAPVGPGALDGLPPLAASRAAFAEALVREGCIGETLAAVDAAARLGVATDPAVRAALAVILRDESAHAALAWRALAWLLEQDADGAIRQHLAGVFAEERARWAALPTDAEPSSAAQGHGLLPAAVRARALERGFTEVIAASWAALGGATVVEA